MLCYNCSLFIYSNLVILSLSIYIYIYMYVYIYIYIYVYTCLIVSSYYILISQCSDFISELLRELLQRLRPADAELLRIDAVVLGPVIHIYIYIYIYAYIYIYIRVYIYISLSLYIYIYMSLIYIYIYTYIIHICVYRRTAADRCRGPRAGARGVF